MDRADFEIWSKKHFKAWSERNPQEAALLFSKDCEYYESVFEEPCKTWDDILRLWLVIPENQKDITYKFEIIAVKDNVGIVNWKMRRTLLPSLERQLIDGVYQISLNKEGLCSYFKQWRSVKKV